MRKQKGLIIINQSGPQSCVVPQSLDPPTHAVTPSNFSLTFAPALRTAAMLIKEITAIVIAYSTMLAPRSFLFLLLRF